MLFFYAAFITNYAKKMYQLCSKKDYYAPKKWVCYIQWSRKMKIIGGAKPDDHDNVLALYPDAS